MHKYFAKTQFLGKKIVFLPECHSTNDELMHVLKKNSATEGFLIHTSYQRKGKGQRGNAWLSEPGKNLLFSFLVAPVFMLPKHVYILNVIAGLAVIDTLKAVLPDKLLELKWPNDVYVNDKKISGILVETLLEGRSLENAIIGVGVNINQRDFYLKTATSLFLEAGHDFELDAILESFLLKFERYYLRVKSGENTAILHEYYQVMRWRGELHHYRSQGQEFEGEILGVDDYGRLVVKINNRTMRFDVKDIDFLS